MDALSDEEMEIDQNEIDLRTGSTGTSAFQPITPAQLAAALANATGSPGGQIGWGGPSSSAPRSGLTTPSSIPTPLNTPAPSGAGGGASPGGSLITTEMFSQALQNALAASASSSTGALSGSSPMGSTAPIENVEESLQLMREMGIPDEELSLQALQATNGDVEAAVNLIYAQWMADD
ncbi:Ubiquitin-like protein 7 [Armadillidium vulgare]|nr:Ubiquitin-like protein 7 [Armadillidium vulgare]